MDTFVSTPSSSDVDLLIEKFRIEVSKSSDEVDIGTRRLTLTPTMTAETEVNSNIDQQITDLENLIKKLQDEIIEMNKNADREVEEYTPVIHEDSCEVREDLSNETIILENDCDDVRQNESVRDAMKANSGKETFKTGPYSHVYPLIIHDVVTPIDIGNKTLGHAVADIIYLDTDGRVPDKISPINQDVVDVWDDLPKYTPTENLEVMIDDLQAEITENMETLKDIQLESTDKFEDA